MFCGVIHDGTIRLAVGRIDDGASDDDVRAALPGTSGTATSCHRRYGGNSSASPRYTDDVTGELVMSAGTATHTCPGHTLIV